MRTALLALSVAILALPMPVMADSITYDYTGNDFTNYTGGFSTADSVTGSFTLGAALTDGLTALTVIDPTSFSFTDGIDTISNTTPELSQDVFQVETDASGNITAWAITLEAGPGGFGGQNEIFVNGSTSGGGLDQGIHDEYEYSYEYEYQEPYYYSCGFSTCEGYNTYYETEYNYANEGYGTAYSAGSFAPPVDQVATSATPEPSSLVLLGTGLVGLASFGRRRFRRG